MKRRSLEVLVRDARKYAALARRMRFMARDPGLARRYARLAAAAQVAVILEVERLADAGALSATA